MTPPVSATELLLRILRDNTDPQLSRVQAREWTQLLESARSHRVGPLVWHRLVERGAQESIPESVAAELNEQYLSGWLGAQSWQKQLSRVLAAFHEHEVPVILLKGVYLATHGYPAPALRPMGDMDVLLPAHRMRHGRDALVSLGYALRKPEEWLEWEEHRTHGHPPALFQDGCLPVELHETIEPSSAPFGVPVQDLWSRAGALDCPAGSALFLSQEDQLLHLATHMGRSHLLGSSLVRICDIDVWCVRWGHTADWDAIVERATNFGMGRFVYTALELAHRVLGSPFPSEVRQALYSPEDDAVLEHALALLEEHRGIVAGALSLTRPGRLAPVRLAAALRAIWRSARIRPSSRGRPEDDGGAVENSYSSVSTVQRLLRTAWEARDLPRGASSVRELRAWADGVSRVKPAVQK